MEKLDLTQPLAYRCDDTRQVRILCGDLPGQEPIASYDALRDRVVRHLADGTDANEYCVPGSNFDLVPLRFRVTEPGWYRMRDNDKFHALCIDAPGPFPVIGYWLNRDGEAIAGSRTIDGLGIRNSRHPRDLVERIK